MRYSRFYRLISNITVAITGLAVASTPAVAQLPDTGVSLTLKLGGAMLSTLVFGSGFLLVAPEYTARTTERIRTKPAEALLYGLGVGIAAVFVAVVFVVIFQELGLLLVSPLLIVIIVASQIGYLSVGTTVTERWPLVLCIAVAVSVFYAVVPVLGGLVGFVLSSLGIGAAYLDFRENSRSAA